MKKSRKRFSGPKNIKKIASQRQKLVKSESTLDRIQNTRKKSMKINYFLGSNTTYSPSDLMLENSRFETVSYCLKACMAISSLPSERTNRHPAVTASLKRLILH